MSTNLGGSPVYVISAPRVAAEGLPLGPAAVAISNGRIVEIAAGTEQFGRSADLVLPSGLLAPGLVDIQVNGCFGVDLASADPAGWSTVLGRLPETGVTSFMP